MPNKFLTFGCSSYRQAAKLVGSIQMTFGGTSILLMIHFGIMSRIYNPEGIPDQFWKFSIPTGMISVCSMSMAMLLLDGIYNKSIIQCRLWLAIVTVFMIGSVVVFGLALETEELIPLELKGIMTIGMGLGMYMSWVVGSYHKVLKTELANLHQQLPKLNNSSNTSSRGNSFGGLNDVNTNTNTNNSNLVITLATGIDECESRTRAYTIST